MSVQTGQTVAANIYQLEDAPLYRVGNSRLFWFGFALFPLLVATKMYYSWRNHSREVVWNRMTPEERSWYMKNTTDVGNKRLDFRFAL